MRRAGPTAWKPRLALSEGFFLALWPGSIRIRSSDKSLVSLCWCIRRGTRGEGDGEADHLSPNIQWHKPSHGLSATAELLASNLTLALNCTNCICSHQVWRVSWQKVLWHGIVIACMLLLLVPCLKYLPSMLPTGDIACLLLILKTMLQVFAEYLLVD